VSRATIPALVLLAWMTAVSCVERYPSIGSVSVNGTEVRITSVLGAAGSQIDQIYVVSGSWGAQRGRVLREWSRLRERGAILHFEEVFEPQLRLLYESGVKPDAHWKVEEQFRIPLSAFPVGGKEELWVLALESGVPRDAVRVDTLIRANDLGRHRAEGGESTGRWADSFRTQYSWRPGGALGRQYYEERQDYSGGSFVNRYDVTQAYDKNSNRTAYDRNVVGGYNSDYGKVYNLSYTFNCVNALTAISDGDDANYGCAVTCDANGNITQVDESQLGKPPTPQTNYLYSYFTYDALNRLTEHKTF